jgi:hypothetical protein
MYPRCSLAIAVLLCFGCSALYADGPRFEISYPMSAGPLDGRVMLVIANSDKTEPRYQITFTYESAQAFGVDVDGLGPNSPAVIDSSTLGYPKESLSQVPAGDYFVQAVFNIYETFHLATGKTVKLPPDHGEGQHWQSKPGNLFSKVEKIHFDPASNQVVKISLSEKIPPLADDPKYADNKWVKHLELRSELLSKFWGRDVKLGAVLLLPDGWEEHPDAHYPLIVEQDHFSRGLPGLLSFRTTLPDANLKGRARSQADSAYKLYQDWTAGRMPRVIILSIQHANPYFDDSYAVNSANLGPYGDAIVQELIPYVEHKYRGIGQGWARSVYGGSTGGWETLSSQVFYPDFYNGAWVFCPDTVDFRAYMTMNLYEDKNAFWMEGPFGKSPRPAMRQPDGLILATMEAMNRYELVQGTKGRSGEQLDIWQAVFSTAGDDGYPTPIFNKRTGEIDHRVTEFWREHYDLSHIIQRDWKTLGPKLAGKLHFYVGDADSFYLDRAVHLLDDFLNTTTDPYYRGSFEYGARKPHCYTGDFDQAVGLNQHYIPQMVKHMEQTAPKGADLTSWKY